MSSALRVLFIVFALIVYLGIYLSGYDNVHWLLYIPVAALLFAGATGICPGLKILRAAGLK